MVAQIRLREKTYASAVFAIYGKGWHCKFLVWDSSGSNLVLIPEWDGRMRRQVYVLDSDRTEWVERGKLNGIPEIADDKRILRDIRHGKCPGSVLQIAGRLQEFVILCDRYPLENARHAETFNDLTFGLHDAVVVEIRKEGQGAEIVIDTTWQCAVTLICTGVTENTVWRGLAIEDTGDYFAFSDDGTVTVTFEPLVWGDEKCTEKARLVCRHLEYAVTTDPEELRRIRKTYDTWFDNEETGDFV